MKSFLQNSGNGIGPQILTDARHLGKPANAEGLPVKPVRGRKTKLAAFGLSPSIIKAGSPEYAACLDQANKYRKVRMKELTQIHGYISAGVGALLASASLALAASRYLYQEAANDGDPGLLKTAAKLADSGRQCELAAWELARQEGVMKRRQDTAQAGQPWLLTNAGDPMPKAGRKTNAERQAREMDVPAMPLLESSVEPDDA